MAGTVFIIAILLVAAMVLILLEILTPLFGLLGVLAAGALGAAVWQAYTLSPTAGWILGIALTPLTPIYIVLLVKWLPQTILGRKVFLKKVDPGTGAATPDSSMHKALVGRTATAETPLRPSGAIRVDHHRVIALAESGMIDKGRTVRIIQADATNVIVREIDDPQ